MSSYGYFTWIDYEHKTGNERTPTYFFDVFAQKYEIKGWFYNNKSSVTAIPIYGDFTDTIVCEVDGNVGHSRTHQTKQNYQNRVNRINFCKSQGYRFFDFRTEDLVGMGYRSKKYNTKISVFDSVFLLKEVFKII